MGKISKVMPLPRSIPPGKGGKPYGKVQNLHLKYDTASPHILFTSKFHNLVFWAKFKQNKQNPLNSLIYSANCAKFTPIINLFVLCFRHLPWQRTLRNSSELRKFRTIRPHSPRIARNSHHLLTLHLMFQMPDQWQRTP